LDRPRAHAQRTTRRLADVLRTLSGGAVRARRGRLRPVLASTGRGVRRGVHASTGTGGPARAPVPTSRRRLERQRPLGRGRKGVAHRPRSARWSQGDRPGHAAAVRRATARSRARGLPGEGAGRRSTTRAGPRGTGAAASTVPPAGTRGAVRRRLRRTGTDRRAGGPACLGRHHTTPARAARLTSAY